jgi:hypothetical protein
MFNSDPHKQRGRLITVAVLVAGWVFMGLLIQRTHSNFILIILGGLGYIGVAATAVWAVDKFWSR